MVVFTTAHEDELRFQDEINGCERGRAVIDDDLPVERIYRKRERADWKKVIHQPDEKPYSPDDPHYQAYVMGPVGCLQDKDDCGLVIGYVQCSCKTNELIQHCGNLGCPTCYPARLRKIVNRVDKVQDNLIRKYKAEGDYRGPLEPKHVVFTISHDAITNEEDFSKDILGNYQKLKRLASNVVKKAFRGFYAGYHVIHTHRFKHHDGTTCDNPQCQEEHIQVWGPHIHFEGYGFLRKADDFEYSQLTRKQQDITKVWKYHVIDKGQKRDFGATLYYLLTHSAIVYRRYNHELVLDGYQTGQYELRTRANNSYSPVGAFSPSFTRTKTSNELVEDICENCNEQRYTHHAIHIGDTIIYGLPEIHYLQETTVTITTYHDDDDLRRRWVKWWALRELTWGDLRTTQRLRGGDE